MPVAQAVAEELPESVIGNDFTIEGQQITIRCKGSLRVNGNIHADLHSRRLVVGETAVIHGAIAAENVEVLGKVHGTILGQRVKLRASADVEGDVHSQLLEIEQGASFDGRSRRVNDPREIAPQLEPASVAGSGARGASAPATPSAVVPPPGPRLLA
jgi:cytoskeletal protein CcmA (bactofilin family)